MARAAGPMWGHDDGGDIIAGAAGGFLCVRERKLGITDETTYCVDYATGNRTVHYVRTLGPPLTRPDIGRGALPSGLSPYGRPDVFPPGFEDQSG